MKSFKEFLKESKKSDELEMATADHIHTMGEKGGLAEGRIRAVRPRVNTTYSDVYIQYIPKGQSNWNESWLEIKMNHTDNLTNVRMLYKNGLWQCKTKALPTNLACSWMNEPGSKASKFIDELVQFMNSNHPRAGGGDWTPNNIEIYSTKTDRENSKNAVTYEQLFDFVKKVRKSGYIFDATGINVAEIACKYYTSENEGEGKAVAAYYLQTGDDLFRLSSKNPLGWEYFNELPEFKDFYGDFKVRVGTRSDNHEIMPELKVYRKSVSASKFSLKPGSKKRLPFKTNSES